MEDAGIQEKEGAFGCSEKKGGPKERGVRLSHLGFAVFFEQSETARVEASRSLG